MNEAWQRIFKNYVGSYDAIETLSSNGIVDDEGENGLKIRLLTDIIETMRSEVF